MSTRLSLFAALLLVACGSSEAAPPPQTAAPVQAAPSDHYSGQWRGLADVTSTLPNAPEEMDIVATIVNDSAQCGTFEYGAIGCSGTWTCTSGFGQTSMVVQESVRFGHERCPQGGRVELRATNDPDVLEFHYTNAGISAHGQLNRLRM
ncbi:MAG: hypothetical protein VYE22_27080 [Myxococcota bacterium]|nr:hypothetical protein [Myxococcota bacterium]